LYNACMRCIPVYHVYTLQTSPGRKIMSSCLIGYLYMFWETSLYLRKRRQPACGQQTVNDDDDEPILRHVLNSTNNRNSLQAFAGTN